MQNCIDIYTYNNNGEVETRNSKDQEQGSQKIKGGHTVYS